MCGVAGTINFSFGTAEVLKKALEHRGPDSQHIYRHKNLSLVHTRLYIQDIAHGDQPFECGGYVMVFNGEIYNHLELRKTHLKGFVFKTLSDTETLLCLYIKYRKKMFDMLDGMFAFCIFDTKNNTLILARDRAGKKPLYLYKENSKLLFASELNALKAGVGEVEIDEDEISNSLRHGFFFQNRTAYRGVSELEAGYMYEIDIDTLVIKKERYFDIRDFYKKEKIESFEDAKSQLDSILHKSVKDRLLSSDLEVGAFLSGGIDSSLIVAVASQYVENLKSFTVKFDEGYDESHLARLTAKKYNTEHYELRISMNLKDDVEKILLNYGEPFADSSAIPSYYVSVEAKKHVSVILNGDGADEIFGGYRRYVPAGNDWLKKASYLSFLTRVLPQAHNKKSLYNYAYRLLAMSSKEGVDFYNSASSDIFEDIYQFEDSSTCREMDSFIRGVQKQNLSQLSQMLYLDFNLILKSNLLKKIDIATMSQSLEGRSPFLSKHMLEFAPRLDDKLKIKGTTTKYLLRELARDYLPLELISQPKRGFEIPLKAWVNGELKESIFDSLGESCYAQNFVNRRFIDDLKAKKIKVSDEKRAKMLWSMYCLEVWKKGLDYT